MAVREFNGTTDTMSHSSGGLSAMTYGTMACIFKTDSIASDRWYGAWHNSGGTFLAALMDSAICAMYSGAFSIGPALTVGPWYLVVVRKATGTATPRFSVYNFTATTWTHDVGSAALADWTAPGASGTFRTEVEGAERPDGRVAVRACWSNAVHWTADASGDTAIEGAGLEDSLANWVTEAPDALWPFNQDPLSAVDDIIGAADQSSVTGTTVVTGDDPPGFSFDLGAGPEMMPRAVVVAG